MFEYIWFYFAIFIAVVVIIYIYSITFKIYKKLYINIRNLRLHIDAYNDFDTLNRDIDVKYNPAILSFLYNQKIEPQKDLLATILNLYNKDAISIVKDSNRYRFIQKSDCKNLKLDETEKYVYDCCIKEKEKFSIAEWTRIVCNEFDKYNFSYIHKKNSKKSMLIITIIGIIMSIIATAFMHKPIINALEFKYGLYIVDFVIFLISFSIIMAIILGFKGLTTLTGIRLTKKGKQELKKWIKFRKFMDNYTLIKDRKIEEIVLYEKYIPYAMVLGLNKEYNNQEVKEFIKKFNLSYRKELGIMYIDF